MKVLMISHSLVTRSNHRFPEELARIPGVELEVFTPDWWPEESRNVRQEKTTDPYYRVRMGRTWFPRAPLPNEFVFRTGLAQAIRQFQPDLIDASEEPFSAVMGQILLLRRALAPKSRLIFYSFQNILKRYPPPFSSIERWAFREASAACVSVREIGDVLRRKGYAGEVAINPPGVDEALFRPLPGVRSEVRASLGIAPAAQVIGYLGRLTPEKGIEELVGSLAEQPGVRALIIGGGDRVPIETQARKLGVADRLVFTGPVNRLDMPRYFAAMDALAVPSRTTPRWKEQFGRVVAEAMLCGVPVMGSNSGSIPEVLAGNGVIFPERSSSALADAAWLVLGQPQFAQTMAEKARAYALEHYTWGQVAAQRHEVYLRVLGEG